MVDGLIQWLSASRCHRVLTTQENLEISGNLLILENSRKTQGIWNWRILVF